MTEMPTPIYCGHCGKRCGMATRQDGGLVGIRPWRRGSSRRQRDEVAVRLRDISNRLEPPTEWPCPECGGLVRLDNADLRRVGQDKRLVAAKVINYK
jgi:hypothetical protein